MLDPFTLLFGGPVVLAIMAVAGLFLAPMAVHFYQTGSDSDDLGDRVIRWLIGSVFLLVWGLLLLAYVLPLGTFFVGSGVSKFGVTLLWLGLPIAAILTRLSEMSTGPERSLCAIFASVLRGAWVVITGVIALPAIIYGGFVLLRYFVGAEQT